MQVLAAALAAAQHRKSQLRGTTASTPQEPVATPARSGKRQLPPKVTLESPNVSTGAGSSRDKVTPDPKQIRVGPSPSIPASETVGLFLSCFCYVYSVRVFGNSLFKIYRYN